MSTPRLLLLLMVLTPTAALLLGGVATTALLRAADTVAGVGDDAEQLVRVQSLAAELVRTDAVTATTYLAGEEAPPGTTTEAARRLVAAGQTGPEDQPGLQRVAAALVDYTARTAAAQQNQGQPAGAAQLEQAGAGLRAEALPALEALGAASTIRIAAQRGLADVAVVAVVAAVSLLVLVGVARWVRQRFHRRIDPGLSGATALLAVAALLSTGTLLHTDRGLASLEAGSLADLGHLATARSSALDARALESRTLILPGSAAAGEAAWLEQQQRVEQALAGVGDPRLSTGWQRYVEVHQQIRALAEEDDRDAAVTLATTGAPEGSDAQAAAFVAEVEQGLAREVAGSQDVLAGQRLLLGIAAAVVPGLALAAGLLALVGLQSRRREYE